MCTCVHNGHLYMSVVTSLLYVEAFKTQYMAVFLQGRLTTVHDKVAAHKMCQP